MPHFTDCPKHEGQDEYICQVCAKILCSGCFPPVWRPDITGHKQAGNACPACLKKHEEKILVTHIYGSIDGASEQPKKIESVYPSNSPSKTSQVAFERFKVWLRERELPEDALYKFMYMGKTDRDYQFKNINTRNYLNINIVPKTFNL